ncbi:MAG: chemotaxis protein CheB [Rhodospirillaceae bacterium]
MSAPRHIRLLIVDDSRFIRMALRAIVDIDPDIEVIGEACNGADAIALARVLRPDVITMDLEMPDIDGLEAIAAIMAERPTPIIVLSAHTRTGVWTTFQALGRGAVDFIEKPVALESMDTRTIERDFLSKIHHWSRRPHGAPWGARHQPLSGSNTSQPPTTAPPTHTPAPPTHTPPPPPPPPPPPSVTHGRRPKPQSLPAASNRPGNCDLVVVAVSTGGPNTMPLLLRGMAGPLRCPMVVAQHMPGLFTSGFAEHLALASGLEVIEGEDNMPLSPGRIVIIAGGCDGEILRTPTGLRLRQRRGDDSVIHPSGDLLFESAVIAARTPVAVVLTGIGCDGTAGARSFAARQFPVLVQTPATAVVWGMPSSVIEAGYATRIANAEEIGLELARLAGE